MPESHFTSMKRAWSISAAAHLLGTDCRPGGRSERRSRPIRGRPRRSAYGRPMRSRGCPRHPGLLRHLPEVVLPARSLVHHGQMPVGPGGRAWRRRGCGRACPPPRRCPSSRCSGPRRPGRSPPGSRWVLPVGRRAGHARPAAPRERPSRSGDARSRPSADPAAAGATGSVERRGVRVRAPAGARPRPTPKPPRPRPRAMSRSGRALTPTRRPSRARRRRLLRNRRNLDPEPALPCSGAKRLGAERVALVAALQVAARRTRRGGPREQRTPSTPAARRRGSEHPLGRGGRRAGGRRASRRTSAGRSRQGRNRFEKEPPSDVWAAHPRSVLR